MKPFKGVISEWTLVDGRVHGKCIYHTTYGNGIHDNGPITTSSVVAITPVPNSAAKFLQTKNSMYVLI